jgi:hypothetical protein
MDRPASAGDLHESRSTTPRDEDHVLSEALRPASEPERGTTQDVSSSSTQDQPIQPTAKPVVDCDRCGFLGALVRQSCQECDKTTELSEDVITSLQEQGINSFPLQKLPIYDLNHPRDSVGFVSRLHPNNSGTESTESDDNGEPQFSSDVMADTASSKSEESTKPATDTTSSEPGETTKPAASIQSTETVRPVNKGKERAVSSSASINSTKANKSTASAKSTETIKVMYKAEQKAFSTSASSKSDKIAKARDKGKRRASSISEGPFTKHNSEVEAQQQKRKEEWQQKAESSETGARAAECGRQGRHGDVLKMTSNPSHNAFLKNNHATKPSSFNNATKPSSIRDTRYRNNTTDGYLIHLARNKPPLAQNTEAGRPPTPDRNPKREILGTRGLAAETAKINVRSPKTPSTRTPGRSNRSLAYDLAHTAHTASTGTISGTTEVQPSPEPPMAVPANPTGKTGAEKEDEATSKCPCSCERGMWGCCMDAFRWWFI